MKIYTRKGDDGTTSLANGQRISKTSPQLEAYGTIDELNSHVGLLISMMKEPPLFLNSVQNDLFAIGAILAGADPSQLPDITPRIAELETQIDDITSTLPPLHSFILPAGTQAACQAHICRTVTRRAERLATKAYPHPKAPLLPYLNRLSDYFFVLARHINHLTSTPEQSWKP